MNSSQMMEIRDCIKYEPNAEELNAYLDGLVEVVEAVRPLKVRGRSIAELDSRLNKAIAKLDLGITDQDIAETMPPEPGR